MGPRGLATKPQFDDGSQADEELTEYVPGSGFAYQLTGFTNVLSRLAAGIRGEFDVNPDGDGTLIRWTYEFMPLAGRRNPQVPPGGSIRTLAASSSARRAEPLTDPSRAVPAAACS